MLFVIMVFRLFIIIVIEVLNIDANIESVRPLECVLYFLIFGFHVAMSAFYCYLTIIINKNYNDLRDSNNLGKGK